MHKCLVIFSICLLASCASAPKPQQVQKIERLTKEELANIMPAPVSQLSFESLLEMSRQGESADAVITKLKETDTSFDLTPSQMLELKQQGVDVKVLDYLHEQRLEGLRHKVSNVFVDKIKAKDEEIELLKRQLRFQSMMGDPFCNGPFLRGYPFGIRGGFGYW